MGVVADEDECSFVFEERLGEPLDSVDVEMGFGRAGGRPMIFWENSALVALLVTEDGSALRQSPEAN